MLVNSRKFINSWLCNGIPLTVDNSHSYFDWLLIRKSIIFKCRPSSRLVTFSVTFLSVQQLYYWTAFLLLSLLLIPICHRCLCNLLTVTSQRIRLSGLQLIGVVNILQNQIKVNINSANCLSLFYSSYCYWHPEIL